MTYQVASLSWAWMIFCWGSHITGLAVAVFSPQRMTVFDLPIMLFQAYTACRPAELVDGTKTRGGKDLLLDDVSISEAYGPKASRQSCSQQHFERQLPVESCLVSQEADEGEPDSEAADSVFDGDAGFNSDETDG